MKPKSASFPYERRASAIFGTIRRPVAHVELYSAVFQRWIAYTMIVDTGADYCVLPASIAWDLGIKLRQCEPHTASGIGGQQKVFLHRTAQMRFGSWEFLVPVGFVKRENLPPLLGRYQCLDLFDLRLRAFVTTFSVRSHFPTSPTP
ncbi:MAG: retropepsin-like aspartic protease [Candidatus Binatia bacterium]